MLVALIAVGAWFFLRLRPDTAGLGKGNGRIEATEIDVATKIAGRVRDVLVDEGDFVEAGQVLANIQSDTLQAQFAEAEAQHRQGPRERATRPPQKLSCRRVNPKRRRESNVLVALKH